MPQVGGGCGFLEAVHVPVRDKQIKALYIDVVRRIPSLLGSTHWDWLQVNGNHPGSGC